jgi:hypothetical protein
MLAFDVVRCRSSWCRDKLDKPGVIGSSPVPPDRARSFTSAVTVRRSEERGLGSLSVDGGALRNSGGIHGM